MLKGDWPLGAVPKGDTRDPKDSRFFLDPTRIGENDPRSGHQMQKIKIAERRNQSDSHSRIPWLWALNKMVNEIITQILVLDSLERPRMCRKNDRYTL